MNVKRYFAASLTVFVAAAVIEFLIHGVLLSGAYRLTASVWRTDMQSMAWIMWLVDLAVAFPFTYIFVKGYGGKGVVEGLRFGAIIGVFASVPMACGMYVMVTVPFSLAVQWFVYGMIEMILLGMVAAAVYHPAKQQAAG